MDLLEVKSRVAEALVESIFRRARYTVEPFQRDSTAPLRMGREDFSPDFAVRMPTAVNREEHWLLEVKYRSSVDQFLSVENQRGDRSLFHMMRRHWPSLYFILVTERPETGRSCFQALAFETVRFGEPFRMLDLIEMKEFGLFPHNLEDHEALTRRIFNSLTA